MVMTIVPLACYWALATIIAWIVLTITSPIGYSIHGVTNLARHLYFNTIEVFVLCLQLVRTLHLHANRRLIDHFRLQFAVVLAWMGYAFTRNSFDSVLESNSSASSGTAMAT